MTNADENILSGQCHCGRVRYRIIGAPTKVCFCHCDSCRRITGAPVTVAVMGGGEQFEFLAEEPNYYQSSENVRRGFCSNCGTPICWTGVWHNRPQMFVYAGTLHNIDDVVPDRHAFNNSQVSWLRVNENLPTYDDSSPP